ncbi:MAG: ArsR family transcriptional regulator, partial [Thermoplasmata archaeon]|nr:ArsR family transcriptional regulator [Thermoplasmata archaeon]
EPFQLQSETRREMIQAMLSQPQRHTQLSKDLNISPAETTRHLNRLMQSNILIKRPDLTYEVTRYGQLLYEKYLEMEYFTDHQDYFDRKDLSAIPMEFMSLLVITQGTIIKGPMKVAGELFNMTSGSQIFSWSMSIGPLEPFILENINKLDQGVEMRFLQQREQKVPSNYMNSTKYNIQFRTLKKVDIGIHVNENRALVILPDSRQGIDYSSAIVGDTPTFLRWASMLFEYFWEDASFLNL